MTVRLHPIVSAELDQCGRAWTLLPGKKHHKLTIDGIFVTIIPRGSHAKEDDHRREALNCRGHIRRFLKGQK